MAGGEPRRDRRGRVPVEAQRAEGPGGAQPFQQHGREPGVAQRLVDRPARVRAVLGMADQGGREGGRQGRADAQQQLVAVPVDVEEQVQQSGVDPGGSSSAAETVLSLLMVRPLPANQR